LKINDSGKNIKSKLELASFRVLHGTTDTGRCETAVVPRSSKHGHRRLILTNTRHPWHAMEYLGACAIEVLTTARQSIVCGRAARPHNYRPIDCVQSWLSDCAVGF